MVIILILIGDIELLIYIIIDEITNICIDNLRNIVELVNNFSKVLNILRVPIFIYL